jgi:tetratricopeptide (TPR) repeat protein
MGISREYLRIKMKMTRLLIFSIFCVLFMSLSGCVSLTERESSSDRIEISYEAVDAAFGWYQKGLNTENANEEVDYFTKAIELNPYFADAYSMRALVLAENIGDYDKALTDINRAISLNPQKADYFSCRGYIFRLKKQPYKALANCKKAISIDAQNELAHFEMGNVFAISLRNYEKAIESYSKSIEIEPNQPYAYVNRSFTYYMIEEYQKSFEDCDGALQIDDSVAKAYANRGIANAALGNYAQAVEDIAQAMKIAPEDEDFYYDRGLIYYHSGEYQKAILDFDRYIQQVPNGIYVQDAKRIRKKCSAKLK